MSQYSTGTASSTAGSNVITGSGTMWLNRVHAGDEFFFEGDVTPYVVASVASNTQLTLTANYPSTRSADNYAIVIDFTANLGLPIVWQGDMKFPEIYSRAMQIIDSELGSWVAFSLNTLTFEFSGTVSSSPTYMYSGATQMSLAFGVPMTGDGYVWALSLLYAYSANLDGDTVSLKVYKNGVLWFSVPLPESSGSNNLLALDQTDFDNASGESSFYGYEQGDVLSFALDPSNTSGNQPSVAAILKVDLAQYHA